MMERFWQVPKQAYQDWFSEKPRRPALNGIFNL
jgi:hypothetical protein